MDFKKEARYQGHIKDCLRDGSGEYKFAHGGNDFFIYDGTWKKGVRQGTNGRFKMDGVFEYVGEFRNGEMTGLGKKTWTDGRSYDGEFLDGEFHGNGIWRRPSMNQSYQGEFKNNQRHGQGTLQIGNTVYRGMFSNHKMHGRGTFECGEELLIFGEFENNILSGQGRISWPGIGSFIGSTRNGVMDGEGVFITEDKGFEYDGSWLGGLPVQSQVANYLWGRYEGFCTPPAAEAPDNKKKSAASSKASKGKEEAPVAIPEVAAGRDLGKIVVRTSRTPRPASPTNDESAAIPAKFKTGKSLSTMKMDTDTGSVVRFPVPDLYDVPCEWKRRVLLRLRAVTAGNEANGKPILGEPVRLWLKTQSLDDVGSDRSRFPCSGLVHALGVRIDYSSQANKQNGLLSEADESGDAESTIEVPLDKLALEHGEGGGCPSWKGGLERTLASQNVVTGMDGVQGVRVQSGQALSFQLDCLRLNGSEKSMTFVVDFQLEPVALVAAFRRAMHEAKHNAEIARRKSKTHGKSTTDSSNQLLPSRANSMITPLSTMSKEMMTHPSTAKFGEGGTGGSMRNAVTTEITLLSLSRCFSGKESDSSRLQLVMLVSETNMIKLAKKISKLSKESGVETADQGGLSNVASNTTLESVPNSSVNQNITNSTSSLIGSSDALWMDCTYELRLVTVTKEVVPFNENSSPSSRLPIETIEEGLTSNGAAVAETLDSPSQELKSSLAKQSAKVSVDSNKSAKSVMIVEKEPDLTIEGHSLDFLEISRQPVYSEVVSFTVCGRWSEQSFASCDWHSLALTISDGKPIDSLQINLTQSDAVPQIASLAVDGVFKPKLSGGNNNNNQADEDFELAPQYSPGREIQDDALLAWLPETTDVSNGEGEENFGLTVRVGGGASFAASVKTVGAFSSGNRPDPLTLTECFGRWRYSREEMARLALEEQTARERQDAEVAWWGDDEHEAGSKENRKSVDATDALIDSSNRPNAPDTTNVPSECCSVTEVPLLLLCGSTETNRVVIPTNTPPGDYVLEIADGIPEGCRRKKLLDELAGAPSPASVVRFADEAGPETTQDDNKNSLEGFAKKVRFVGELEEFREIRLRILPCS